MWNKITRNRARLLFNRHYHKAVYGSLGTGGGFTLLLIIILLPYLKYILIGTALIILAVFLYKRHKKKRQKQQLMYNRYPPQIYAPPVMSGHDFEHYCADILKHNGYINVSVTKGSGDNGADIIAERDGIRYAIQTKYYNSGNVGNNAVQQVYAGCKMYNCTVGIVLTNSLFTPSAKETANKLGIVLWDGQMLGNLAAKAYMSQRVGVQPQVPQPMPHVMPPQPNFMPPPYIPPQQYKPPYSVTPPKY